MTKLSKPLRAHAFRYPPLSNETVLHCFRSGDALAAGLAAEVYRSRFPLRRIIRKGRSRKCVRKPSEKPHKGWQWEKSFTGSWREVKYE